MKIMKKTLSFILALCLISTSIVFTGGGAAFAAGEIYAVVYSSTPAATDTMWFEFDITEETIGCRLTRLDVYQGSSGFRIINYYGSNYNTPATAANNTLAWQLANSAGPIVPIATVTEPCHVTIKHEFTGTYTTTDTVYINGVEVAKNVGKQNKNNNTDSVWPMASRGSISYQKLYDGKSTTTYEGYFSDPTGSYRVGDNSKQPQYFANITVNDGVEDVTLTTGDNAWEGFGITCPAGTTWNKLLTKINKGSATVKINGISVDENDTTELTTGTKITLTSETEKLSNEYTVTTVDATDPGEPNQTKPVVMTYNDSSLINSSTNIVMAKHNENMFGAKATDGIYKVTLKEKTGMSGSSAALTADTIPMIEDGSVYKVKFSVAAASAWGNLNLSTYLPIRNGEASMHADNDKANKSWIGLTPNTGKLAGYNGGFLTLPDEYPELACDTEKFYTYEYVYHYVVGDKVNVDIYRDGILIANASIAKDAFVQSGATFKNLGFAHDSDHERNIYMRDVSVTYYAPSIADQAVVNGYTLPSTVTEFTASSTGDVYTTEASLTIAQAEEKLAKDGFTVNLVNANGNDMADSADLTDCYLKITSGTSTYYKKIDYQEPVIQTITSEVYDIDNREHTIKGVMAYSKVEDMIENLDFVPGYNPVTDTGLVKDGMTFTVTDGTNPIDYIVTVDKVSYDYSTSTSSSFATAQYDVANDRDVLLFHIKEWTATESSYVVPYITLATTGTKYVFTFDEAKKPLFANTYIENPFVNGQKYNDLYVVIDLVEHNADAIFNGKRIGHLSNTECKDSCIKPEQILNSFALGGCNSNYTKAKADIYKVASKTAVLNDLITDSEKYNNITISQSGNKYTASVLPYEYQDGHILYFAEYNAAGELVNIKFDDSTETAKNKGSTKDVPKFGFGKYEVEISPSSNSNKIRAFFWDGNLTPIDSTDLTAVSGLTLSQEEPVAASPALLSTALKNPNYKGIITNETIDNGIDMQIRIHSSGNEIKNGDSAVATAKDPSEYKLVVTLAEKTTGSIENKVEYNSLYQDMKLNLSADTLEIGSDYILLTELIDKESGERADRNIHTIRRRADFSGLKYYVDESGRLIDGETGNPEFYTFLYLGNDSEGDLPMVAQGSYDAVMRYWNDAQNGKDPYGDDFFVMANTNNLGVMANMGYFGDETDAPYVFPDVLGDYEKNLITGWTDYLKNKDDLDMYYIGDEQKPQMRDRIRWRNELINDLDLGRPNVFVDMRNNKDTIFGHNQSADIMALDVYMIKNAADNEFGRIGTQYTKPVSDNFINKPVWAVHQAADYGYIYNDGNTYGSPTEQQMLNIAMQSVVNGATGIGWYSYNDMKDGSDYSEQLIKLNSVNTDLESLSDIIMSDEKKPDIEVEIDPYTYNGNTYTNHINYMVKSYNGETYVFLVQTGMHPSTKVGYDEPNKWNFGTKKWHPEKEGVTVTLKAPGISIDEYVLNKSGDSHLCQVSSSDENQVTLIMPTYAVCVIKLNHN